MLSLWDLIILDELTKEDEKKEKIDDIVSSISSCYSEEEVREVLEDVDIELEDSDLEEISRRTGVSISRREF